MNKWNLMKVLACVTFASFSFAGQAGLANASERQDISSETKLVMQSEFFVHAWQEQQNKNFQSGLVTQIAETVTIPMDTVTYVYFRLQTRSLDDTNAPWVDAGSLIGVIDIHENMKVVTAVYFKPIESGPGGASVGNMEPM